MVRVEYDDGVDLRLNKKQPPEPGVTRIGRERGFYAIEGSTSQRIRIGYLRLSEIPALEKLINDFRYLKDRRSRTRNLIWDGPETYVGRTYKLAREHSTCPACDQEAYFNDPNRTAEDFENAMPSAWAHICGKKR